MIRAGRGKVKGLYRATGRAFLAGHGSAAAALAGAREFLDTLRYCRSATEATPWLKLMLEFIRKRKIWSQLSHEEQDQLVKEFRDWEPWPATRQEENDGPVA